ncbi:hypothetical protein B9Z55_023113 [Caenorhabditis nigoni]|uniref:Uncharacterized protein n=1 Tax=Caenorhabditis nigoni TaxID=1611254 RepID=A0A2G5SNV4_9PELO|nr:hypothetical protein B9Z55_023113 [Caenorhabditis nigoni]
MEPHTEQIVACTLSFCTTEVFRKPRKGVNYHGFGNKLCRLWREFLKTLTTAIVKEDCVVVLIFSLDSALSISVLLPCQVIRDLRKENERRSSGK